jgi:pimeloyl-ACP methyl ester carboxylesterase
VAQAWIPLCDGHPAYHLYGQSFGGILAFEALTAASGPPLPRSMPLSNVVMLPGVAHHALLERPAAYGAQLKAFLQKLEG